MVGSETNGLRQRSVDPTTNGKSYGSTNGASGSKLVISEAGKAADKRLDQHET